MMRSQSIWAAPFCITLLLSLTAHAEQPRRYAPCQDSQVYAGQDKRFVSGLTYDIPWQAWADLLNEHWSQVEIAQNRLFSAAQMRALTKDLAALEPEDNEAWGYKVWEPSPAPVAGGSTRGQLVSRTLYVPPSAADAKSTAAYDKAAQAFDADDWAKATPLFDVVAVDKNSPYRAAAAYSAARAALDLGKFDDGVARIEKIIGDPSLREFHLAAYHLIGTRASQTGEPRLIGARYAEIEHILLAPPGLVCPDALASDVYNQAQVDFNWYLSSSFPGYYNPNATRRAVLDQLATADPFFDVTRAIVAPTPYNGAAGWLSIETVVPKSTSPFRRSLNPIDLALKDSAAITAHAREQWLKTKNPLWGYALAQRTADINDVPLINDMIVGLASLPKTSAVDYAAPAFRRFFARHAVRVLLMNGKIDDALDTLHKNWNPDDESFENNMNYCLGFGLCLRGNDNSAAIVDGGIRLFLEKFELDNARRWAAEVVKLLPRTQIDPRLRPLLATSYDELVSGKIPGDGRNIYGPEHYEGQLPREAVDLLPTSKILALADITGISASEKRAFLSAGWLRTYLLGDNVRVMSLLPQMRENFAELASDIDDILGSWMQSTKQHLLTHLILRTPGLSPRTAWARTGVGNDIRSRRPHGGEDIFRIDYGDPSDGNWWCPVDVDQAKLDMVQAFFVEPLDINNQWYTDPLFPRGQSYNPEWDERHNPEFRKQRLALADRLIAWHPLLKDADLDELQKLSKIDSGPRLLSGQAIAWAQGSNWLTRKFGFDKYLPETLHLAVRSTRYGCRRNGSHLAYSREAWRELHNLYPKSEWAMQTPYWFSGEINR